MAELRERVARAMAGYDDATWQALGNIAQQKYRRHADAAIAAVLQDLEAPSEAYQLGRADFANEAAQWLKKPAQAVMQKERQPIFDEAACLASMAMQAWASKEFEKLPVELQFDVQRMDAIRFQYRKEQSHD